MATRPHTERVVYRRLYQAPVFGLAEKLTRLFGRQTARAVAGSVAWSYAATQQGVTRTVKENLQLLQRKPVTMQDARRVFLNFSRALADYVYVGTKSRSEAASLCSGLTGGEPLLEIARSGRGALLATGHFGFFEYGALVLGEMGIPVTVVTHSEPTAELTDWRARYRRRWGAETIEMGPDSFSALEVVRALEAGRFCAMLVDRPFGPHWQEVEAPNGRLAFSASPAIVAGLAKAPIIPVAVIAGSDGRYELDAAPPIEPVRLPEGRQASIAAMTQKMAGLLLERFSAHPTQWYQFVPVRR